MFVWKALRAWDHKGTAVLYKAWDHKGTAVLYKAWDHKGTAVPLTGSLNT